MLHETTNLFKSLLSLTMAFAMLLSLAGSALAQAGTLQWLDRSF